MKFIFLTTSSGRILVNAAEIAYCREISDLQTMVIMVSKETHFVTEPIWKIGELL